MICIKRFNIFLIIIIIIIISKIFGFYKQIKDKVLEIKNPLNIARLYKGIINEDRDVAYMEDEFYLTSLEDGVVTYIGNNSKYNDFIIVSGVNNTYLYYNLDMIDITLYEYLYKNDIISYKENTGVVKID